MVPRSADDIQKDFNETCAKLGHSMYTLKLYESENRKLVERLAEINQEALDRKKLDQEAAQQKTMESKEGESNA